jgi:hypothetical protein
VEFVLAGLLGLVSLEEDDSAALVAGREVVAGLIELDSGYYVRLSNVFYITLVAKAPSGHQSQLAVISSMLYHERPAVQSSGSRTVLSAMLAQSRIRLCDDALCRQGLRMSVGRRAQADPPSCERTRRNQALDRLQPRSLMTLSKRILPRVLAVRRRGWCGPESRSSLL